MIASIYSTTQCQKWKHYISIFFALGCIQRLARWVEGTREPSVKTLHLNTFCRLMEAFPVK